ncbi:phosphotransferase family protein [Pseudorhodoferax sp. LjRoot39]|uniref:phosphotransferase family protein n=1 Tax=Pseudorhodoferax sp. LjRoot39 TaxID=3342328 RepID=UPI003ECC652A
MNSSTPTRAVPDWQAAVDLDRLAAWMDAEGLGQGPIGSAVPLAGGTQNLLLRFARGGQGFVLRRPAPGRPAGSSTIDREAMVLKALAATEVPHPRLLGACLDAAVLGAPFYLTEPVDGFNPSGRPLPAPPAADPAWRHRMGLAMVDALLRLGEVHPQRAGLAGFGRPKGFLERQVPRWRKQLQGYAGLPGWPGADGVPGLQALGEWLAAHMPARFTPGLLHGDFHLSNVMFRPDAPEIAAVVDWELATIGDPLLDLGWLLATWPDASGHGAGTIHVQPWDGFPQPEELVAHYRAGSPRDLAQLPWYVALAGYKLAILLEGSHARACAGLAPTTIGERHHASAQRLVAQALARIEDDTANRLKESLPC